MKMVLTWKKLKAAVVEENEHQPETGRQTRQRRRENLMKAMTMKQTIGSKLTYLSLVAAAFGLAFAGTGAGAQGVPKYVVSSHSTLTTTVPAPGETGKPGAPTFTDTNGIGPTMGVNSIGDLFVQVQDYDSSSTITYEFPADGSPGIPFYTSQGEYGGAGVAVDALNNVYLASEQGYGGADSGMFEFPYTNGSYPSPYIYSSNAPPGICYGASGVTATNPVAHGANTSVCALGSYVGAAYYYWQPYEIAVDYSGATYMSSNYDNTLGNSRTGIFYCDVLCNQQATGANALVLIPKDSAPNTPGHRYAISAMVGNPVNPANGGAPGDIYWVDGNDGYYINNVEPPHGTSVFYVVGAAAQGAAQTSNISLLDSSYVNPAGISFDRAGNLYVTDTATGVWETPLINGQLDVSQKFLLFPLSASNIGSAVADTRGNVYYSPYNDDLEKGQLFAGTFPSAPVGTASAAKTFTITFNSTTTLGAITVLQGGAPATEFTVAPGTCAAGTSFAVGSTCTFTSTFTPSGVGTRSGSIVVADSNGAVTVTYLKGTGTGAAVTVDPGTPTLIGSTGLKTPTGVAVDAAGNTFVADPTANAVYEYPAGGGAAISIGSNLSVPTGVAVDPAGNVFIVNQGPSGASNPSGTVVEVPNVNGSLVTASQTTVFNALSAPTDIVIDSNGNFFITNSGNNEVLQFPSLSRYGSITTAVSLGSNLSNPTGIALDASSNVYVADTGNSQVEEIGNGFQATVGSGYSNPTGVAVDASGALFVADQGTGRVLRVPYEAGFGLDANDQVLVDTPLNYPTSIRLDAAGNLYASDNTLAELYQVERNSGAIDFLSWNLNTPSGPNTIVISSTGTAGSATATPSVTGGLVLGSPLYTLPAGTEFTVGNAAAATGPSQLGLGTLCPTAPVSPSTQIILPAGQSCLLSAVFTPTASGQVSDTLAINLAAPATNTATPAVLLTGTGVSLDAATATIEIDQNSAQPLQYSVPFTIDFTITPSGQTAPATGIVRFALDGQNQNTNPLNPTGTALGSPSTAGHVFNKINAGNHTVQAHYEGDANYASVESPVLNITIDPGTVQNVLTVTGDSAAPLSAAPTDPVNMVVILSPAVNGVYIKGSVTGNVTFYAGTTVLGVSPVNTDPKTQIVSASLSLKTIPLGFYTLSAVYSGNANYTPQTSNSVSLVISNPTFTVIPTNTTATATATSPGVYNMVVTSYSNFQGGVDFACSGLPANSYCVFRPGVATLQDVPYATVVSVPSVPVVLRIEVAQNPQTVAGSQTSSIGWIGAMLAAVLLFFARRKRSVRGLIATSLLVLLSFGGVMALNGCTASTFTAPQYATPAGTYQVTVTATGTPVLKNVQQPATANVTSTFQLSVTVK